MGIDDLKLHWIFHLKLSSRYIIAGGFFRDNFLGIPPKDIDVYVDLFGLHGLVDKLRSKIATVEELGKEKLLGANIPWKSHSLEEYEKIVEVRRENKLPIKSVVKITTWLGEKLDVIVLENLLSLEEILRTFDVTINQFGWEWDGNEGIFLSSGAGLKDLWHRRLTIYNDNQIDDTRMEYLKEKGFKQWEQ